MTTIRVPQEVAVSPESGEVLRLDTDTQTFRDDHGNVWPATDLVGTRESNRLREWLDANYPRT